MTKTKSEAGFVLACDIGTSDMKTALIAKDGAVFNSYRMSILDCPRVWEEAFIECCFHTIGQDSPCVKAIVVSGNGPTVICSDGEAVFYYEDTSEFAINKASLFQEKLSALKKWHAQSYAKSDFIFGASEYLLHAIGASRFTILPEWRFRSTYAGMLHNIVPPACYVGFLKSSIMEALHLKAKVPLITGAPDYIVAMIGTGCLTQGDLCDRAGTSEGFNLVTSKPIVATHIRTLPSVQRGLWNASVLIPDSSKQKDKDPNLLLQTITMLLSELKNAALSSGQIFPDKAYITGGQALDKEFLQQKKIATGLDYIVGKCTDSELLGDGILGWYRLHSYPDIKTAALFMARGASL